MNKKFFLALFAVFSVFLINGFGQVTTGSIQGVVTDPNGAVVPGANVRVTNVPTGVVRESTTNDDGFYRVTNLIPGDSYRVEVSAANFGTTAAEPVAVRLAAENVADIRLNVAGASATVDVTDAAQQVIQSTQSQLRSDFETRQVQQLPLVGGSVENLALLVPGVTTPGDTDFANGTGIAANGNRGRSNNFQLDAQDNNDNSVSGPALTITNQDAIGEFQVITNSFSAEFGRNAGAQINAVTRSGTNDLNGSIFYFLQNSALNARTNIEERNQQSLRFLANNGFASQLGGIVDRPRDPFTNNRFGIAVGGPIAFLNFGEGGPFARIFRNKAFFFATYQGDITRGESTVQNLGTGGVTFTRESALLANQFFPNAATNQLVSTASGGGPAFTGQGQFFVVPQVADTNGDGIPDVFNFGANNPFGNTPSASLFAPSVVICTINPGLGNCPAANRVTLSSGEAIRVIRADNSQHQFITREDFNFSSKDFVTFRYIFDKSNFPLATGRALAGALFDVPSTTNNAGITYTRSFTPNFVNEARFNFSNLDVSFGNTNIASGPSIAFSGQRDISGNFGSLTFGTQSTLPQSREVRVFQEQNTITTTIGSHGIKAGFDFRQQRTDNFFLPNFLGTFTFRGSSLAGTLPTGVFFNADGTPRTGAPNAFENLLLNRPRDINFALGNPRFEIDQDDYFFFVQDDWRVFQNLTLNLGVRYEVSTQPLNKLIDQLGVREGNDATAIFPNSFGLDTRTLDRIPIDKNNIAPRVGFAYSPSIRFLGDRFSNGRTVLRAGFGIAYDPSFFNIVLNSVTAAPFVGAGTIRQNSPGTVGQTLGVGSLPTTTAQLALTPSTNGGDPRLFNQTRVSDNFHNPYVMSFNAGIQQELYNNGVLEVRYVGTLIRDQFQTVNANPDTRFLEAAGVFVSGNAGQFTNGFLGTARTGTTANGRLDPNFGPVRLRNNNANGNYNGLQVEFRTRISELALNTNYTFSKSIDNASEIFSTLGGGQTIALAQNPFDLNTGERGLSAFDQRHVFTSSFVAGSPFFRNQSGFLGKMFGGIQFSGIIRVGSGRPYTPATVFGTVDPNFENAFVGSGVLRPFNGNDTAPIGTIAFGSSAASVVFGDERAAPGQFIVYNTNQPGSSGVVVSDVQAALQQSRLIYNDFGLFSQFGVPLGDLEAFRYFRTPFGDVGRNTFFGEPFATVDLGFLKTTKIYEDLRVEFRAEASNLFNRRNFGVPDPITEDAFIPFTTTTGVVGTFQNPGFNNGGSRTLRFGVRVLF